jgi:predicted TIM-barrel fold metal-dependent hydrolase
MCYRKSMPHDQLKPDLDRRALLKALGISALASPLLSCFGSISAADALAAARPTGPKTFGEAALPTHFRSYRDLARLPYFEVDDAGRLRCVVDEAHGAIDFHTHLGMSYLFSGTVDLQQKAPNTAYLFNCDGVESPCLLNLNIYQNHLASEEILDDLRWELIKSGLPGGSAAAETHTIPNLFAEMDALGLERAVLLPVALSLPFNANPTEDWHAAAQACSNPERLITFASVHPEDDDALDDLRRFAQMGASGVKLHPPMQSVFPDSEASMEIYQECERLDLPVLFHAGRAGIEPSDSQQYALMKHYLRPVAEFPKVRFVFGHSGCRMDADEALAIAKEHRNVWMEISGQGLEQLQKMRTELDPTRILYGTDWPFYPQAPALAKVLMLAGEDKSLARMILRENALQFLEG